VHFSSVLPSASSGASIGEETGGSAGRAAFGGTGILYMGDSIIIVGQVELSHLSP